MRHGLALLVALAFVRPDATQTPVFSSRVDAALAATMPGFDTALVDGVFAGMMVGESEVGRSLLIVFCDGIDTASCSPPIAGSNSAGAPTSSSTPSHRADRGRTF